MTHVRETRTGAAAAHQAALDRRAEMVLLVEAGMPEADIAERMRCSLRTVQRHLLEAGIRKPGTTTGTNPRRMSDAERDRARKMLEDGQSYHAVGKSLGRDMATIERNVPGFAKLTPAERAERAVLGRQFRRLERRLR